MNKNTIRLTEGQLKRVIKESVQKILTESSIPGWDYPAYYDDEIEYPDGLEAEFTENVLFFNGEEEEYDKKVQFLASNNDIDIEVCDDTLTPEERDYVVNVYLKDPYFLNICKEDGEKALFAKYCYDE